MLVLCQKLHICTYNRQNFSGDGPLFGDPVPKLQVLEPSMILNVDIHGCLLQTNSRRTKPNIFIPSVEYEVCANSNV